MLRHLTSSPLFIPRQWRVLFAASLAGATACTDAIAPTPKSIRPPVDRGPSLAVVTAANFTISHLKTTSTSLGIGINNFDHAVGGYLGCFNQCFTGVRWLTTDFPTDTTDKVRGSLAHDIGDGGEVIGSHGTASSPNVAYIWTKTSGLIELPPLPGNFISEGRAIGGHGFVVGRSGNDFQNGSAVLWVPTSPGAPTYMPPIRLPSLGGCCTEARDVNGIGQIVGYSSRPGSSVQRAVLWQPVNPGSSSYTIVELGGLGGPGESFANDLNDRGQIVGWASAPDGILHAFLWTPDSDNGAVGTMEDIGMMFGSTFAYGINNSEIVVGATGGRGFVWSRNGGMSLLPDLYGSYGNAIPYDINNRNTIVGEGSHASSGNRQAVIWFYRSFNEAPVANAGGPYSGREGSPIAFSGSASTDSDGDPITYSWDFGDGNTGSGEQPVHRYADNGSYTVTLTVTDPDGESSSSTSVADIANVAPSLSELEGLSSDPVAAGSGATVSLTASITDPGSADTHQGSATWGDGATTSVSIADGVVSATHTYTSAGVYTVTVDVSDDDGGADSKSFQYVVVYDPSAGFVTGGGWIDSPAGSYTADPDLAGKATFGFQSRYERGASIPRGNTEFHFHAASLNFNSTAYEWLVVAGAKAQYKGSGQINGAGDYRFMLTATDGQLPGGGGVDRLRVKIWDPVTGDVLYDNQKGASDDATPATALGGGNIVIRQK